MRYCMLKLPPQSHVRAAAPIRRGSSSVWSRAAAFQVVGRGFESHLPLQFVCRVLALHQPRETARSIPISRSKPRPQRLRRSSWTHPKIGCAPYFVGRGVDSNSSSSPDDVAQPGAHLVSRFAAVAVRSVLIIDRHEFVAVPEHVHRHATAHPGGLAARQSHDAIRGSSCPQPDLLSRRPA